MPFYSNLSTICYSSHAPIITVTTFAVSTFQILAISNCKRLYIFFHFESFFITIHILYDEFVTSLKIEKHLGIFVLSFCILCTNSTEVDLASTLSGTTNKVLVLRSIISTKPFQPKSTGLVQK